MVGVISFEGFENVFGRDVEKTALQKLKDRLDLIVEQDDWDGEDLIGDNYKSPELVEIVIYYASGYLCHHLQSTKCEVCLS